MQVRTTNYFNLAVAEAVSLTTKFDSLPSCFSYIWCAILDTTILVARPTCFKGYSLVKINNFSGLPCMYLRVHMFVVNLFSAGLRYI